MFRKRGFIVSQALLYAFSFVVVVMIIFWGYKGLTTFSSSAEMSELNSFGLKFTSDMEKLSFKKGSLKEFTYMVPTNYDYLCIFDLEKTIYLNSTIMTYYPDLKDYLEDQAGNVFLVKKTNVYPLKSDYVFISKFPYYHCKKIFNGVLKFSAKGGVYNGEVSTEILVNTIAKKNLNDTKGFTPTTSVTGYNCFNSTVNYKLDSTDYLAYLKIPKETKVCLPGTNNTLSLELIYPEDVDAGSEEYIISPLDTFFEVHNASIGIKPKLTVCDDDSPPSLTGYNFLECEEGYALFEIDRVI